MPTTRPDHADHLSERSGAGRHVNLAYIAPKCWNLPDFRLILYWTSLPLDWRRPNAYHTSVPMLALLLAAAVAAAPSPDAEARYVRGNELANAGRVEEAKQEYLAAIALDPEHLKARFNLAGILQGRGEHAAALTQLDAAVVLLDKDPAYAYIKAPAFLMRGRARLALGSPAGALEDLDASVSHDPKNWATYLARAQAYRRLGQVEDAERDERRAEELRPSDPYVHYNEGSAHLAAGRYKEAIAALSRAIDIKPDFIQAYNNRAIAYLRDGQIENARRDQQRVRELSGTPPR